MLQNILKINGVKKLAKTIQEEVNGGVRGLILIPASCEQTCVNASAGTPCGPPHCPGVCDGNGGSHRY